MTSFDPHFIELDGGRPLWVIFDRDWIFLVNVVEHDGTHLCLWSGSNYGEAILEAEAARKDFGIEVPVRDIVMGGP